MIFKREFLKNLKSLIIWSAVLGGLILIMLSIYPQFASQQKSMNELLKAYPDAMKKAFGMDKLNFGTLLGFYGVEIYVMTTLLGSIYGAILASNIIAKEQSEKTIEFLLSKPVTRPQLVTEKLATVIVNILLLNGISFITSIIGFQFAKDADVPIKTFLLLTSATLLLHLTFAAISFMLSAVMRKTRNILSISLGIVLVSYFLHVMSGVSDKLENLKYVSFFKYVDASDIVTKNTLNTPYIFVMTAVIFITILGSYMIYKQKDIAV